MKRRDRTEILIKGNVDLSRKLCKEIESKYEIKKIEEPNYGLTMLKMRESAKKSLFYIGEVLVTEAKVYVNGVVGIGIVTGDKEELAYNLAVIDGAFNAMVPEVEVWKSLLIEEKKKIQESELIEDRKIMKTKVDFTTMDVEY